LGASTAPALRSRSQCPSPAATPPSGHPGVHQPGAAAALLVATLGFFVAYRVGMIIFVAASTACAAAPTLPVLIAARIVQVTVKDQAHNVSLC
jgi:hypothetical protein